MKSLAYIATFLIFAVGQIRACNTADLIEGYGAAGQSEMGAQIGRPSSQYAWITPDNRFVIHYDMTGNWAVYHADEDINPADGIPDYVNRTADYLEAAYDSLVLNLGFDPPPFDGMQGGDYRYDVYLTDNLGLTTPESPSYQYPGRPAYTSYIEVGYDMRYLSRYGDDPYPFLKVSIAHEYFHAIEFAYRVYSSDLTFWWFEACANWAEEKVFTDVNDVYYSLPAYLSNPHHSLYQTSGQFTYGAWLFPEYLDERFGSDLLVSCWQKFARYDFSINAIMNALQDIGANLNNEYCQHVIWNYFAGNSNSFYREGANFGSCVFEARTHTSYPVNWNQAPISLENMSSSYITFNRNDEGHSTLIIEYHNITTDRQAVCLAIIRPGIPVQYNIYDANTEVSQILSVSMFGREDKVVLMPIWLYETNPKEEYTTYLYRAYLRDTLITDVNEANSPITDYSLDSTYPNPFNGAVSISFDAPGSKPFTMRIYDVIGRTISERSGISNEGLNTVTWQPPADLASGVLFYVIDFGQKRLDGKMSLLK